MDWLGSNHKCWIPPKHSECLKAIGEKEEVFSDMAHWEEVFPQKRPLERGDWLESTGAKDRKGQPVSCFLKTGIPKPTKESVILLCPFGDFEAQFARHSGADLALLANYVSEFFSIKTEVIPPVSKEVMSKIKSRNHGGKASAPYDRLSRCLGQNLQDLSWKSLLYCWREHGGFISSTRLEFCFWSSRLDHPHWNLLFLSLSS